jgi:asparagine synthase (glutamine-hydrolysing)
VCGISGWFDMEGKRAPDRLLAKAMADAISHRGPDGEGFHFEPGVALGHRRLAIIDLATGDQPMFTEGDRVAIVFNGEIYNYRELRRRLEGCGHNFRTRSDTEVILRAWIEWGEACVTQLHGMFAFALWDRKLQSLFLARDRLGEKPLHYAILSDKSIIFGSELKALTVHPGLDRKIDPCAVEDFFSFGYIADPKTIYRDARKLGAGCTLTVPRGGSPRFKQYWDPRPVESGKITLASAAEALRERLGAAVKSQLVADVPVGTFLSGGVDSSAITALAAGQVSGALNAFTIGFDDPRFDERAYAKAVADRYGVRHFVESLTKDDPGSVKALTDIFDEPFGDSSALPTYWLAQLARRNVKVALSGDGGDELFAGYRRYLFHKREEKIRSFFPAPLRRPLFRLLANIYPQLDWAPRFLRARQTFRELSQDAAEGYFHNVMVVDDATRKRLFSDSLKREIGGYRASEVIAEHMKKAPGNDPVSVAQYVDLKTWLVSDILTKVDRTAMACGLEVRVPMLDPDFVGWTLGLPPELKLAGGEGKIVLKKALQPLLPHEVLYRRKQGFSMPLASWFRGSFGEGFARQMSEGAGALEQYFDLGYAGRPHALVALDVQWFSQPPGTGSIGGACYRRGRLMIGCKGVTESA